MTATVERRWFCCSWSVFGIVIEINWLIIDLNLGFGQPKTVKSVFDWIMGTDLMFAAHLMDDSRVTVNFIYRWAFDPDCCYWFELAVCDVAIVDAVACEFRNQIDYWIFGQFSRYNFCVFYLHLNQCRCDNIWINCCHKPSCVWCWLNRIHVLEHTVWFSASAFIFPVTLNLISVTPQ